MENASLSKCLQKHDLRHGPEGNNFFFNAKLADVSAEDAYDHGLFRSLGRVLDDVDTLSSWNKRGTGLVFLGVTSVKSRHMTVWEEIVRTHTVYSHREHMSNFCRMVRIFDYNRSKAMFP